MVENKIVWEPVEIESTRGGSRPRLKNVVTLSPKNNLVQISSNLYEAAGWPLNEKGSIRCSLYKSGSMLAIKPNPVGALICAKKRNSGALRVQSLPLKLTILSSTGTTERRLDKRIDYEAWVDGDMIVFRYVG